MTFDISIVKKQSLLKDFSKKEEKTSVCEIASFEKGLESSQYYPLYHSAAAPVRGRKIWISDPVPPIEVEINGNKALFAAGIYRPDFPNDNFLSSLVSRFSFDNGATWIPGDVIIAPYSLPDGFQVGIWNGCFIKDIHNSAGFGKEAIIGLISEAMPKGQQTALYVAEKFGEPFKRIAAVLLPPAKDTDAGEDFRDGRVAWDGSQWLLTISVSYGFLFYVSHNLQDWKLTDEWVAPGRTKNQGGGIECPTPLAINGDHINLIIYGDQSDEGAPQPYVKNPMMMEGAFAILGHWNTETCKWTTKGEPQRLSYGWDDYAPAAWKKDGRIFMQNWAGNWAYQNQMPYESAFNYECLIREITLDEDNLLKTSPIEEQKKLFKHEICHEEKLALKPKHRLTGDKPLPCAYYCRFELDASQCGWEPDAIPENVNLNLSASLGNPGFQIFVNLKAKTASFYRRLAGFTPDGLSFDGAAKWNAVSVIRIKQTECGHFVLTFFVDSASVEFFCTASGESGTLQFFPPAVPSRWTLTTDKPIHAKLSISIL